MSYKQIKGATSRGEGGRKFLATGVASTQSVRRIDCAEDSVIEYESDLAVLPAGSDTGVSTTVKLEGQAWIPPEHIKNVKFTTGSGTIWFA